jgi:hypothetical protein
MLKLRSRGADTMVGAGHDDKPLFDDCRGHHAARATSRDIGLLRTKHTLYGPRKLIERNMKSHGVEANFSTTTQFEVEHDASRPLVALKS